MKGRRGGPFTVVAFHAHPDDEALLTGGTLARATADGHRVVLVTATRGDLGLAGAQDGLGADLARVRMAELESSARILGSARVLWLGYADSGLTTGPDAGRGPGSADAFAAADVATAAELLADVLREERADVLMIYDRNGGYGHPDHVQVHRVGRRAADLAGTPLVLEATVPGGLFRIVMRVLRSVGHPFGHTPLGTDRVFSRSRQITHRINVTSSLQQKRSAITAHGSQRRAEGGVRVLDRIVRLPLPLFGLAFGREWFIEHGRTPRRGPRKESDVFATLRSH